MRTLPLLIAIALPVAAFAKPHDPLAGFHQKGKPVDCLQTRFYESTDYIGTTAIVFSDGLGSAYVNDVGGDCPLDHQNVAFTVRTPQDQLCRGDIIELFDPSSHIFYGSCALGSFTPYAR